MDIESSVPMILIRCHQKSPVNRTTPSETMTSGKPCGRMEGSVTISANCPAVSSFSAAATQWALFVKASMNVIAVVNSHHTQSGQEMDQIRLCDMVGEILNRGGERLQNPSTPRAVNNNNFFEDN